MSQTLMQPPASKKCAAACQQKYLASMKTSLPVVILPFFVLLVAISVVTVHAAGVQAPSTSARSAQGLQNHDAFGGIWVLNREKSEIPGAANPVDIGGGGFGGRGGAGRGGFGGQRGGRGEDPEQLQAQLQAMTNYVRRAVAASNRLTMVVHDSSVGITDADGAMLTLQTDNKKVEQRAENGLIRLTRRARWDVSALVYRSEEHTSELQSQR